jgi:hypothetical protein
MEQRSDDLDQLYDKLQWENPSPNFTGRVLARAQHAYRAQRISMVSSLVALAALGIGGFALGRGLTFSGTLDFLGVLASNLDFIADAADDVWQAFLDIAPWTELSVVVLCIIGIWLAATVLPRWLNRSWSNR